MKLLSNLKERGKWLLFRIGIFWTSFFYGMKQGNKLLTDVQDKDNLGAAFGEEQRKEQDNVFGDLLRGEVTQRVVETRHEMYLSERESYKYQYAGGGKGKKLNNVFDYTGHVENEDNKKIILVQENELMVKGRDEAEPNDTKCLQDFRLHFDYEFFPRFRLDRYCTKVVVKESGQKIYPLILDVYVSKYPTDRPSAFFITEMKKILNGDNLNDIVNFRHLTFITQDAWGEEHAMKKTYGGFKFTKIMEYDGNYILRFKCKGEQTEDIYEKYYDPATAEKIKNKAPRDNKGAAYDFNLAENKENKQD